MLVNQVAIDRRSHGHFNQIIINAAINRSLSSKLQMLRGIDVTMNCTINNHTRRRYITHYLANLGNPKHRITAVFSQYPALNATINMQAARKTYIAFYSGM